MEVHAELQTESKMFCRCPVAFGGEPNTRVCPICLGLPGSLPVPNQRAIELVLTTALALNCNIAMRSIFHRKNYFYPDLPKGYQVSQYGETNPLGYYGYLELPSGKKVRIRRVHLEEDTGKLMHLTTGGSGVDYNRAGVPLMELVTDFPPDISNAEESKEYLTRLRQILVYLGVCDGKLEEGSLRCEPNISIRPEGASEYGVKSELKNLGSFKSVQLGVDYEVARQRRALESGESLRQETRGWNEQREESFAMRIKETENDYRYFPDPDLAMMVFEESYIERLRAALPELPLAKAKRYRTDLGLNDYDAELMTAERDWSEYFEQVIGFGAEAKAVCNWMNSDFAMLLNEEGLKPLQSKVSPAALAELTKLVQDGTINGKTAKDLLKEVFAEGGMPADIVQKKGLVQVSDESLILGLAQQAIAANPDTLAKFLAGQESVSGFFVGQVMKASQGKAKPDVVQRIVRQELDRSRGNSG